MCGTPWQSRRCQCYAVSTPVGFALSALVPQENFCCLWAWTTNTPSPSGSGRKVNNLTLTFGPILGIRKSVHSWEIRLSLPAALLFRGQSGQPYRSHPKDFCGWISAGLWHTFRVCGDQTRAFLDVSWSSFAQQKRCAEFHWGCPDADYAVCCIWSCKWLLTTIICSVCFWNI